MKIETVKIKSGNSCVVINKSDFNDKEHELFNATAPKKRAAVTRKRVKK